MYSWNLKFIYNLLFFEIFNHTLIFVYLYLKIKILFQYYIGKLLKLSILQDGKLILLI